MKQWIYWLRTVIFYLIFGPWTALWCTWVVLTIYFVPLRCRHGYAVAFYSRVSVWLCRLICGVRWRLEGAEHIPKTPCVIAANHQSTWETFYLQALFTPQATVVKQELFKLPFFGWALRTLKPIAINRSDARMAISQMNTQGKAALNNRLWVMIFPEGTRHDWPKPGRYTRGAATLASKAGVPVLPVVHDAGRYWPNKKWLKMPGEIIVRIGHPIETEGKTTKAVNDILESWTQEKIPRH